MEYLDRLLARGERYPELAHRLEAAISAALKAARRTPGHGRRPAQDRTHRAAQAAAELIASAAGEVMFGELFDRLGTGARSLLVRAAAFRGPVAAGLLAARPGHIAECEAAGLLTIASGRELAVHRWMAGELHRRLAAASLGGQLAAAHRQAAAYWLSRPGQRGELEAAYHQRRADELARGRRRPRPVRPGGCGWPGRRARRLVGRAGRRGRPRAVPAAPGSAEGRAPASSVRAGSAPVSSATAARDQAAAWVARQVSGAAVIACDPAMCAALAQHGVPSGNLLVLGPGAGDPLGSDVVLGTAAVRGLFGSRLAAVYAPEVLGLRHRPGADRRPHRRAGRVGRVPAGARGRPAGPPGGRHSCCATRGWQRRRPPAPRSRPARSTRAC